MKEIEVKAILKNPGAVTEKLLALGCRLSAPITQKDTIFLKKGIAYDQIKPGVVVLRIRQENDKIFLTLKMRGAIELNKIEHEILVDNATEARELVKNLGFVEVLRINKVRQKGKWHDYTICLDEIESLGMFIEVEQLIESEDDETVSAQLSTFLQDLDIRPEDHIHKGYDTLLFKKIIKNFK